MKTLFLINPVSGKGKTRIHDKTEKSIHKHFNKAGFDYKIIKCGDPGEIDAIIQQARAGGYEAIVAAGGDGTINEIAKRLVGTDIALGVIPLGSGNGLARHLGYSVKPRKAVRQLISANLVKADSGDFGGIPFMNNAGIGLDAEVAKRFSRGEKRGIKSYVRLGVKLLFAFKAFDCKLEVDGISYDVKRLLFIDITNGTQWGGGAKIAPQSKVTDGFLEAIIVERTSIFRMPRMLGMLFDGTLHRHPNVKVIRGKHFKIVRAKAGNAHVDGESVKLGKTIECEIREQSLSLLVPVRRNLV